MKYFDILIGILLADPFVILVFWCGVDLIIDILNEII